MQITGNYQIYSNKTLNKSYRYQNYNNNSQYQVRNNINCTVQNTSSDKYLATQIAFTALPPETQLKAAVENIFNRSIVFGPKEYKNLSKEDLSVLHEFEYIFTEADYYHSIGTIKRFAKLFSEGIHEKYPEGFTLVAIGRSPALLAKYLEFQGEDVKYCPISNICLRGIEFPPYFVQEYKKYLDNIGLTKEFVQNTQKPIIITDYKYSGSTYMNFLKLLALPEIGIEKGKTIFRDIRDIATITSDSSNVYNFPTKSYNWLFDETMAGKRYTSIPRINAISYEKGCDDEEKLNKYYQNGNKFEENNNTKMMNFILADSIYNV